MKKKVLVLCLVAVLVCILAWEIMEHVVRRSVFSHTDSMLRTTQVIVAKRELPALTIIAASNIEKKTVLMREAAPGVLAGEAASLGRVLNLAVAKGQILTESSFVPERSTEELVSKLPAGMQAFTVSLGMRYVESALLYPGSIVDVVCINKMPPSSGGALYAFTLFSRIVVLDVHIALEGTRQILDVTLQVNKRQAAGLELALSVGGISLVQRNPPPDSTGLVFIPASQLVPPAALRLSDSIRTNPQVPKDQTLPRSPE